MATNNSENSQFTNNADGYALSGGTTARSLTVTGANMTLTGSGTNVYTFPSATATLAGLAIVQTWTAAQSFNSSDLILKGSSSGTTTLNSGAAAGSSVLTLPIATDTLVGKATTDVFTNKDLTSTTNIFPTGSTVQFVSALFSAVATGTTVIPEDDTLPQSTEGDQYMTVTITPKSTTNTLKIEVNAMLSFSVANAFYQAALFQDSGASAIAVSAPLQATATGISMATMIYTMAAGTTSATTFKIRAGGNGAGTMTFNGQSGARLYSTAVKSSMTVTEYKS